MLKRSFFIYLLLVSANTTIISHPDEYDITTECLINLKKINEDGVQLPGIIYGFCRSLAQRNESSTDKLCRMINELRSETDKLVQCQYKPASWYLTTFIAQHPQEVEKLFAERYAGKKDIQVTWAWFEKAVYKKCLIPKVEEYQKELVVADDKMLKKSGRYGNFRIIGSTFYRLTHTTNTTWDVHE